MNLLITVAFVTAVSGGGLALVASIWGLDDSMKVGLSVMSVGVLAFGSLLVVAAVSNFDDDKPHLSSKGNKE